MSKTLVYGAVVAALIGASIVAEPPPAYAAGRDGVCQSGEFCYYYSSGLQGSVSDFTDSLSNYGSASAPATCYVFKGPGSGQGQCIRNNAASVWNRTAGPVTVYYSTGYGGPSQTIPSGGQVNLNSSLRNNNASHKFGGSTSYGQPNTNPNPSAGGRAPNATARTQFVDDEIARLTGETQCWVGDYRSWERSTSNHNSGNALDCTISNSIGTRPTAAQRDQGWLLANWLRQHANRLQVRYVIWDGKIWSVARSSEGWRTYSRAGSGVTLGHYDHVHVSIQNPYGD